MSLFEFDEATDARLLIQPKITLEADLQINSINKIINCRIFKSMNKRQVEIIARAVEETSTINHNQYVETSNLSTLLIFGL